MLTLLRLPAVMAAPGLGRSAIYDAIRAATFPAPIAITRRTRGWIAEEVETWISRRIAASRESRVSETAAPIAGKVGAL